jgi:hypothetical protein
MTTPTHTCAHSHSHTHVHTQIHTHTHNSPITYRTEGHTIRGQVHLTHPVVAVPVAKAGGEVVPEDVVVGTMGKGLREDTGVSLVHRSDHTQIGKDRIGTQHTHKGLRPASGVEAQIVVGLVEVIVTVVHCELEQAIPDEGHPAVGVREANQLTDAHEI